MRREMDLRTPEFIASQRPIKPRFVAALASVMLLFLLFCAYQGLVIYKNNLKIIAGDEKVALQNLTDKTAKLQSAAGEIELYQQKSALEETISISSIPVSACLLKITATATANRVILSDILISATGKLQLKGSSETVRNVTSFNSALLQLPFIRAATITSIDMAGEQNYLFNLSGSYITAGGAVNPDD